MMRIIGLILLLVPVTLHAQLHEGTDFWFAYMRNLNPAFNLPPTFDVSIEAVENANVTVTFGDPSNPDDGLIYEQQTLSLNAGESDVLTFGPGQFYIEEPGPPVALVFHVESTGNIRVTAHHNRLYFSESSPILPTQNLGTEYLVLGYNEGGEFGQFTVVATEDNTELVIDASVDVADGTGGVPYTINMNEGDAYTISATNNDLTATTVSSNNPIACFTGTNQGLVDGCGASSHLWEQQLPNNLWGNIYGFVPFAEKQGDVLRFIAIEDNTEIYTDCDDLLVELDEGETFTAVFDDPEIFTSSNDFAVLQLMRGLECGTGQIGDPNLIFLQPLEQANNEFIINMDLALDDQPDIGIGNGGDPVYYVNVIIRTEEITQLLIDGSQPSANWFTFEANPGLSHASIATPSFSNEIVISTNGNAVFHGIAYGMSQYDAYSWHIGSDALMEIPPLEDFEIDLGENPNICEGESFTLDIGNVVGDVLWSTDEDTPQITVTEAGIYEVTVTDACAEGTGSIEVFVSPSVEAELHESYELCENSEVMLEVTSFQEQLSFSWSNNTDAASTEVDEPGIYEVTVSADGFCSRTLNTSVNETEQPTLTVPESVALCDQESTTLTASSSNAEPLWEQSNQAILEVTTSGVYTATATNDCGTVSAQSEVTLLPAPEISLIPSLEICQNQAETITAEVVGATSLEWSNNTVGETLEIDAPGTYVLTVSNEIDCFTAASVEVIAIPELTLDVFETLELCEDESLTIGLESNDPSAFWQDSESDQITIDAPGTYIAEANNQCETLTRTLVVEEALCDCPLYAPNAFSPDGNDINELWKVEADCEFLDFQLQVYNRWGEVVFQSTDPSAVWNGDSGSGYYVHNELFHYLITYTLAADPFNPQETGGHITVLR